MYQWYNGEDAEQQKKQCAILVNKTLCEGYSNMIAF